MVVLFGRLSPTEVTEELFSGPAGTKGQYVIKKVSIRAYNNKGMNEDTVDFLAWVYNSFFV